MGAGVWRRSISFLFVFPLFQETEDANGEEEGLSCSLGLTPHQARCLASYFPVPLPKPGYREESLRELEKGCFPALHPIPSPIMTSHRG